MFKECSFATSFIKLNVFYYYYFALMHKEHALFKAFKLSDLIKEMFLKQYSFFLKVVKATCLGLTNFFLWMINDSLYYVEHFYCLL